MKRFYQAFLFLLLLCMPLCVQAQTYQSYGSSGAWIIVYNKIGCYAMPKNYEQSKPSDKPVIMVMIGKNENRVILNFEKDGQWIKQGQTYFTNFILGGALDFHGVAEGMVGDVTGGNLLFGDFPDKYLEHLGKAKRLKVKIENAPDLPIIALDGSRQMLEAVRQCASKKL